MNGVLTIEQLNKRRLAKIHKLKRENRMLASERKKLITNEIVQRCEYHYPSAYNTYRYARHLCRISEQIFLNGVCRHELHQLQALQ